MHVQSLGWEDPLEEGTATHSSILACRIPWTEEPGGLQSIGLQRVRHDLSDLAQAIAHQSPLSMGFSKQEYWSGLLCPPPRDQTHVS